MNYVEQNLCLSKTFNHKSYKHVFPQFKAKKVQYSYMCTNVEGKSKKLLGKEIHM